MAFPYATAATLSRRFSAREMKEVVFEDEGDADACDVDEAVVIADGQAATDDTTDETLELADCITEALTWAHSRVDSYVGVRFAVPYTDGSGGVPAALTDAAVSLARHRLYAARATVVPEGVRDDLAETLSWLERVASGKAALPLPATAEDPAVPTRRILTGVRSDLGVLFANPMF